MQAVLFAQRVIEVCENDFACSRKSQFDQVTPGSYRCDGKVTGWDVGTVAAAGRQQVAAKMTSAAS
jgi:hypothetical protein